MSLSKNCFHQHLMAKYSAVILFIIGWHCLPKFQFSLLQNLKFFFTLQLFLLRTSVSTKSSLKLKGCGSEEVICVSYPQFLDLKKLPDSLSKPNKLDFFNFILFLKFFRLDRPKFSQEHVYLGNLLVVEVKGSDLLTHL